MTHEEMKHEENQNRIARVVEAARDKMTLFHAQDHRGYAAIAEDGHVEHYLIASRPFHQWLSREYFERYHNAVAESVVRDACMLMEGIAARQQEYGVYVRVAWQDNETIIVDLGRPEWQVVEITPGGWQLLEQSPVRFRRPKGLLPMAIPEHGGSLSDLRQFINVSDEEWPLGPGVGGGRHKS